MTATNDGKSLTASRCLINLGDGSVLGWWKENMYRLRAMRKQGDVSQEIRGRFAIFDGFYHVRIARLARKVRIGAIFARKVAMGAIFGPVLEGWGGRKKTCSERKKV